MGDLRCDRQRDRDYSDLLDSAVRLADGAATVGLIKQALEPHCLMIVNINPESRVKVAQGPATPLLVQNDWQQFLVRVYNQAGVTAPLAVSTPDDASHKWIDAQIHSQWPMQGVLSGLELDYRIIQIYSRDAGCAHYADPARGVNPPDMIIHTIGEDLKIGATLTWGPGFDYQKQFFTGAEDAVSQPPCLIRYDVEVSGFGSHQSGHLCLLGLSAQTPPGGDSSDHLPTLSQHPALGQSPGCHLRPRPLGLGPARRDRRPTQN